MDLTQVAITVAKEASASAVPFSGAVVEALLKDVLQVQDEQVAILRSIEGNLERLTAGPWRAGQLRLKEAALPERSPGAVESLLRGAADNFRDAAPLQPEGSFSQAFVFIDLAVTLALLGDTTSSRHYAEQAYLTARRAMWTASERHRRSRSLRGPAEALRVQAEYFRAVELAASALADPTESTQQAMASETVTWRQGALLDRRYLAHQAQLERDAHPSLTPQPAWTEFWGKDESIIGMPAKWV